MNAKAILGLLALGTVALSLRGRRHRSVSGLAATYRSRTGLAPPAPLKDPYRKRKVWEAKWQRQHLLRAAKSEAAKTGQPFRVVLKRLQIAAEQARSEWFRVNRIALRHLTPEGRHAVEAANDDYSRDWALRIDMAQQPWLAEQSIIEGDRHEEGWMPRSERAEELLHVRRVLHKQRRRDIPHEAMVDDIEALAMRDRSLVRRAMTEAEERQRPRRFVDDDLLRRAKDTSAVIRQHTTRFKKGLRGLGLTDEQHGVNRSTLSTAAGFRIRDARRAARNGWCESALTLLRDSEYHAGQVTAHAKSIPGRAGEQPRRKAQALRVAVNRLARDLKQSCSIHRRRAPAGSRRQGKLPFDT